MRILVFSAVAALIFCLLFWGDIFGGGGDESDVIVVKESLEDVAEPQDDAGASPVRTGDEANGEQPDGNVALRQETAVDSDLTELMSRKRWQDALDLLEAQKGDGAWNNREMAAYYRCLSNLGQREKAVQALDQILAVSPLPAEAVDVVLDEIVHLKSSIGKRSLLSRISEGFASLQSDQADRIVEIAAELNRSLPQSISGLYRFESYTIRPNDNLWDICNNYNRRRGLNVEVGLVRCLNGIQGNNIFPDQVLKLPGDKISIRVWKTSWFLSVFLGDTILAAYRVGLGRNDKTPTGSFVIQNKLKDPDWNSKKLGEVIIAGDPRNILGTRWLGFKPSQQYQGYGLHGTEMPDSIGKNMSDGCIRLLNEDVEELFEIVSRGTVVEIS